MGIADPFHPLGAELDYTFVVGRAPRRVRARYAACLRLNDTIFEVHGLMLQDEEAVVGSPNPIVLRVGEHKGGHRLQVLDCPAAQQRGDYCLCRLAFHREWPPSLLLELPGKPRTERCYFGFTFRSSRYSGM